MAADLDGGDLSARRNVFGVNAGSHCVIILSVAAMRRSTKATMAEAQAASAPNCFFQRVRKLNNCVPVVGVAKTVKTGANQEHMATTATILVNIAGVPLIVTMSLVTVGLAAKLVGQVLSATKDVKPISTEKIANLLVVIVSSRQNATNLTGHAKEVAYLVTKTALVKDK